MLHACKFNGQSYVELLIGTIRCRLHGTLLRRAKCMLATSLDHDMTSCPLKLHDARYMAHRPTLTVAVYDYSCKGTYK